MELDPPAPWHPQLSSEAQAIVNNPSNESEAVLRQGVAEGEKLIVGRNFSDNVVQHGWSTSRAANGPGKDIVKRAAGAKFGLGGHYAIENRSYTALNDAQKLPLDGDRALTLRFEANAMPPCDAFWSLTAYGTDMYLVENEIERWSISDRKAGLVYAEDGSLTIHLSAERPADTANWLPVPRGRYLLGMRVYEGKDEVINCEWFPPNLEAT